MLMVSAVSFVSAQGSGTSSYNRFIVGDFQEVGFAKTYSFRSDNTFTERFPIVCANAPCASSVVGQYDVRSGKRPGVQYQLVLTATTGTDETD